MRQLRSFSCGNIKKKEVRQFIILLWFRFLCEATWQAKFLTPSKNKSLNDSLMTEILYIIFE